MIDQLRVYKIFEKTKAAFHERFRDHAMALFARYGGEVIVAWEAAGEDGPEFIYLLRWPDQETLEKGWAGIKTDAGWQKVKADYTAKYGELVAKIDERTLVPTEYSPKF